MVPTEDVSAHVRLIRGRIGNGFVAIYVVLGRRTALVDTGVAGHPAANIAPALAILGLSLREIDLVLTTHRHFDHVGGHASVVAASNATVGIHEADHARMGGLWPRPTPDDAFLAAFRKLGLGRQADERAALLIDHSGDQVVADTMLTDGERIDLGAGVEVDVVHTPGHTGGSLSFVVHPDETALVGDAIQGLGGSSGLPLYEDPQSYRSSLLRIRDLGVPLLGLGHRFRSRYLEGTSPLVRRTSLGSLIEESRSFPLIADQVARQVLTARPPSRGEAVRLFLRGLPAPFDGQDADLEVLGGASAHAALLHLERARTIASTGWAPF